MSDSNNIVNYILNNKLVEAKQLIEKSLISKVGTMLEERIENVAPSMINDVEEEQIENDDIDPVFEDFIDQVHQIIEEIESETGEELTDEEIMIIGEEYLSILNEEGLKGDQEKLDKAKPFGKLTGADFHALGKSNRNKK